MAKKTVAPFETFLRTVLAATNETQKREAFIALAATGFDDETFATEMALGAEHRVKFHSSGVVRRGAVDSFFGNLIIEFENNLEATRGHALEQLRAYVAGAWREDGNHARPYLAVASDGLTWEIFTPSSLQPQSAASVENTVLTPLESWTSAGDPEDAEELRAFLNRLFFRRYFLAPTAANFARDFGLTSAAYASARGTLTQKLSELASDSQVQVYQNAWATSLEISYGSIEPDAQLFAKHTYLAVLARLLVWAAFERRALQPGELEDVLGGIYFRGRQLANLVEDDFFGWYRIASPTDASNVWVALSRQLAGYDLTAVSEDVLKPLYEQLVDPETRHVLGEYYTPDWLATLVVERVLRDWDWQTRSPVVLDPACGSGTFLRAVIDAFLDRFEGKASDDEIVDTVLSCVMGIEVHPLAVIIARATYLITLQDYLASLKRPITVPVFLANSLKMPPLHTAGTLFGNDTIEVLVDGTGYELPTSFVNDGPAYDDAIENVVVVARSYGDPRTPIEQSAASFRARVGHRFDKYGEPSVSDVLGDVARHIAQLIRARRNSVHGFLLKNHYRPSMLRHQFDLVLGNPPWLTVGQIATKDYQQLVIELAKATEIAPRSVGESSHTELATIFLANAFEHFLSVPDSDTLGGIRLGFVMPRSIFTAHHHRNLRQGVYRTRFQVAELWDLDGVSPLFNVPACVLFASSAPKQPSEPKSGFLVEGELEAKDISLEDAESDLSFSNVKFELAYLGKRSAWRVKDDEAEPSAGGKNAYVTEFRQGAILYPQVLMVVEPDEDLDGDLPAVLRVRTSPDAIATAKIKTKKRVNHLVDSATLFFTAAADHIVPFTLLPPLWMVVLPTTSRPGKKHFGATDSNSLRLAGLVHTADWLDWAEAAWRRLRKDGDKTALSDRLDYLHQLSAQSTMRRYVVIYTAAAKRPVAAVFDRTRLRLPFVARDRTFWGSFSSPEEAHYVSAFLNSDFAAASILDWMNRGLFGPRDINKRVLDVPWPGFDADNDLHKALAKLSAELSTAARSLVSKIPDTKSGLQRLWIRKQLGNEMLKPLEEYVASVHEDYQDQRRKGR